MTNPALSPFWLAVGMATAFCFVTAALAVFIAKNIPANRSLKPLLIVALFAAVYAGAKAIVPTIDWPRGVMNHESSFDTNNWEYVDIAWTLGEDYPLDVLFTIEAQHKSGGDRFPVASCLSGDYSNRVTAAALSGNPTNFNYFVTSEYTPGTVSIKDFFAEASRTNLSVTCRWTCPPELVGMPGRLMCRPLDDRSPWHVELSGVMEATNVVTVVGNFVNGRLDREFCVVVEGYTPKMLRNVMNRQLYNYRYLDFMFWKWPAIRAEFNLLKYKKVWPR